MGLVELRLLVGNLEGVAVPVVGVDRILGDVMAVIVMIMTVVVIVAAFAATVVSADGTGKNCERQKQDLQQ